MKKLYIILTAFLMAVNVFAQAPQKMSYQAVIRDASNQLVTSSVIGMKISILQGSATGTAVYVETQAPTSNTNGLVSLEIGTGTKVSGDFSTIDWGNGSYFVKTEADPTSGTNYTITGVSQLLSVPYALHTDKATTVESIHNVKFGQSILTGGGNVELQANIPFIDFKNSDNEDYDIRLSRYSDNELTLVGGDLKLYSGNIIYRNGREKILRLSGLDFSPYKFGTDVKKVISLNGGVYATDGTIDGTRISLIASLRDLPDGANVTKVVFHVVHNADMSGVANTYFVEIANIGNRATYGNPSSLPTKAHGWGTIPIEMLLDKTVDNSQNNYLLQIDLFEHKDVYLVSAEVHYKIYKAD